MAGKYWLMKAEPDSRIVKGKDVKFSVDDFDLARTTQWEGVRNYEARNLMKEMSVEDNILFYHSNCKDPGIAGFAKVSKEAYPDYTAWDSSHPYFDPKSRQDDPKWFMIDATFVSRAVNFVPLSLLRYIADSADSTPPEQIAYIGTDGVKAIKAMPLVARGRLSVQRVNEECWMTIQMMAQKGGWEEMVFRKKKSRTSHDPRHPSRQNPRVMKTKTNPTDEVEASNGGDMATQVNPSNGRKRKAADVDAEPRRSSRTKKED